MFRIIYIAMAVSLFSIVSGCSDGGNSQQNTTPGYSDASMSYYDYLATSRHVDSSSAQPVFPGSGELYSENTSVFKFVPAKTTARLASQAGTLASDFALYSPSTGSSAKKLASTVTDSSLTSSTGIPGIKKHDIIPSGCTGLSGDPLRICLDDLGVSSAPESEHVSQHDARSLKIQIGASAENTIIEKNMGSITSQLSQADRDSVIGKLTDFTNDDSAHSDLNLASFSPFAQSGYSLSTVVITDNSSSDTDGDGTLDHHSTMIAELVKPVNYSRLPSAELDACISKYRDGLIDDRYVVRLTTYVHLDYLSAQRQKFSGYTATPADTTDFDNSLQKYEAAHTVMATNQALDANIIKSIYSSQGVLPPSSTEYTFMFQLAPELISGEYSELLEKITVANDNGCQEIVEQHINPRTAILSGQSASTSTIQKRTVNSLSVFYQIPVFFSQQLSAKFASALIGEVIPAAHDEAALRDYCMVDGNGQKVAIVDPASGEIVPACEKLDQKSVSKIVMLTKQGACKNDKSDWWSYYPSQMRSPKFGRGIQYFLTEWLIHNQAGDYKNIHVYQNAWKAGVQVGVRAGKIVIATYLLGQFKAARFVTAAAPDILFIVDEVMKYSERVLRKAEFSIAKYKFRLASKALDFLAAGTGSTGHLTGSKKAGYLAFIAKLATKTDRGMVAGFLIERLVDSSAQALDVTVVGWQDLSDGSHHGCFKFD